MIYFIITGLVCLVAGIFIGIWIQEEEDNEENFK